MFGGRGRAYVFQGFVLSLINSQARKSWSGLNAYGIKVPSGLTSMNHNIAMSIG